MNDKLRDVILPPISVYLFLRITNVIHPFIISLSLIVGIILFSQTVVSKYNNERHYYSLNDKHY